MHFPYTSTTLYANIEFAIDKNRIYGMIHFRDLKEVSAIHIHTNSKGQPILIWLATSPEWEHGIAQATPLSNAPICYQSSTQNCSLVSPYWVPYTKDCSHTSFPFDMIIDLCDSSYQWQSQSFLFNVHGYQFGHVLHGCSNGLKPSAALLAQAKVKYTPVSKS